MSRCRRILLSAAVLAACICLAWVVVAMLSPRPGVTKANFDRIEKGMTFAQVEEVFGEPPSVAINLFGDEQIWGDGLGRKAFVRFSALAPEGNVIDKEWEDRSEQIYTTICRWLRLPK